MKTFPIIATCTFGLEAIVKRELADLGYQATITSTGRVEFEGDFQAVIEANLWLRCADRILLQVGRFEAQDFEALFENTKALPWEEWLSQEAAFPVAGRSVKSQLSSVPAIQRSVKKAIAEKLEIALDASLTESGTQVGVEVSILENIATLTINTSGVGLHKRGYRDLTGAAPLRETLAAALLLLSFWGPERRLLDPFCGSGTICVEAAMIGRNIAPGIKRQFAAETWYWLEANLNLTTSVENAWRLARKTAHEQMKPELDLHILGSDIDAESLSLARRHARRAGVESAIQFEHRDFSDIREMPDEYGCLVTNPPYGVRLQPREYEHVQALYQNMPLVFRHMPTWSFFIFTSWPNFENLVGKKANRRRKLFNAQIECTYFQFHGPRPPREPESSDSNHADTACTSEQDMTDVAEGRTEVQSDAVHETAAVFGGLTAKADEQAGIFANRLKKMDRHRRRWPTKRGITCYRVYNRDIPEIPLMVDRYEDCLYISEYFRPHDRDVAQHAQWLDLMLLTASKTLEVPQEKVFLKHRRRQKGETQYQKLADRHYTLAVQEGGLRFEVNLSDYLDTGLFLDHRITRSMVREAAKGKRVLNLFAYTGSFSVYAAAGGARHVTTVDLSNTYLDWAARNFKLNSLPLDHHRFVREDTMEFLEDYRQYAGHNQGARFDLVIVDPPTYSNSKRNEQDWDVQLDHVALLSAVRDVMVPGGEIYFSNNYHKFKLHEESLEGFDCIELTRQTVPEDFANKKTHRCWKITV